MPKPAGLVRREGTYYFRLRVPADLINELGRSEIKESLRTKSLGEAKRRRNMRALHWDATFDRLRADHPNAAPVTTAPLTGEAAIDLIRNYVRQRDGEWRRRSMQQPSRSAETKREAEVELSYTLQLLRDPEHPAMNEEVSLVLQRLFGTHSPELAGESIDRGELFHLIRRAVLEIYRRYQAYEF